MKLLGKLPLEETKPRAYALLCPCHKLTAQSQVSIGLRLEKFSSFFAYNRFSR